MGIYAEQTPLVSLRGKETKCPDVIGADEQEPSFGNLRMHDHHAHRRAHVISDTAMEAMRYVKTRRLRLLDLGLTLHASHNEGANTPTS